MQNSLTKRSLALGAVCMVSLVSIALSQAGGTFERAQAQVIKDQTQQILSRSEYRPRRTALEWLGDMFDSWTPKLRIRSGWGYMLLWFVLGWCVLALVAILGHFLWTAALFLGAKQKTGLASRQASFAESHFDKSYEVLLEMAAQSAQKHQYREAIGFQTLAAIKWLDSLRIISFHESKTNGDYLREYRSEAPGETDFRDMLRLSELALYAGALCNSQTYQSMKQLMERMPTHADKDTQI